jgi:Spy/CpxP family protein refolding chaperone
MNRLTPKQRKKLAKEIQRMTPEQRRQLVIALKRQMAGSGMGPRSLPRAK